MKQFPSRLNWKKNHKPRFSNFKLITQKSFVVSAKTSFALRAREASLLNIPQLEACRKSLRRNLRKKGIVHSRLFPSVSITRKSIGARMGKGKGSHSFWAALVRAGQIICEVGGVTQTAGYFALKSASSRLPIKTTIERKKY